MAALYLPEKPIDHINVSRLDDAGNIIGEKQQATFLVALGLIFLGGLILNLMPCVFPVLGLKVLSFVELAGKDPRKIKLHGLIFALGVVISMLILAAIMLTIRETTGRGIQWGAQMQEPLFVGIIAILLSVFALNFYGVFEIGTTLTSVGGEFQQKKGYAGSFFSGILTTVIATPCGAPLLAPAMTYTLQQSIPVALILFIFFALGISLPYIILSFNPKLIDKLPRPGNWMVIFKKSMTFPMLAVVLYFLYVFGKQTGLDGLNWMLWALLAWAVAAFIYGTWSPPYVSKAKRYLLGFGLAASFAALGSFAAYLAIQQKPPAKALATNSTDPHAWIAWQPGIVEMTRSKGRIPWVDYTADW